MKADKKYIRIKYAEVDDLSFSTDQKGWVETFAKHLLQCLELYTEESYIELHLDSTNRVKQDLLTRFDATVYVLSPSFTSSTNVRNEVKRIEQELEYNLDSLNRKLFKVLKAPIKESMIPVSISMGKYYYFYVSSDSDNYQTISASSVEDQKDYYWESLGSLVIDILNAIGWDATSDWRPKSGKSVYLGKCDDAQQRYRNSLVMELESFGFQVLPDHYHSTEILHLENRIAYFLNKSEYAIHFPEEFIDSEGSIDLNLEDKDIKRFIWFNSEVKADAKNENAFYLMRQKLKEEDQIETVNCAIEEFKDILLDKKLNIAIKEERVQPLIYLISSFSDNHEIKKRINIQAQKFGLDVEELDFDHSAIENRNFHMSLLKRAMACILLYDGNNYNWLWANVNEVKKSIGLGRLEALSLAIIAPDSVDLREDVLDDIEWISSSPEKQAKDLENFILKVKSAR
ncbi:MAG: hypothetical protein LAT68_05700 [Cyclobacteriaceae bacterium]|nr:hypothetical protein [Cyclobacteriaceae bacterium]MCH8515806.1 hypothetical protein [Cyclobacteriaceae bacterium]